MDHFLKQTLANINFIIISFNIHYVYSYISASKTSFKFSIIRKWIAADFETLAFFCFQIKEYVLFLYNIIYRVAIDKIEMFRTRLKKKILCQT